MRYPRRGWYYSGNGCADMCSTSLGVGFESRTQESAVLSNSRKPQKTVQKMKTQMIIGQETSGEILLAMKKLDQASLKTWILRLC